MNPGLSYREAAVAGANPVRLVILLYQQAIEDLRRAVEALKRGDIETRARQVDHALQVIGHLQATLDKKEGGTVAQNLDCFYQQLRTGLIAAQCQQSEQAMERQIAHLMQVCDAWYAVEAATSREVNSAAPHSANEGSADWNA